MGAAAEVAEAAIRGVLARPELAGASAGICAQWRGAAPDDLLVAIGADQLLVPASNTKLFTIAAAQHTFGGDHQLRTEFWLEALEGGGPNHRLVLRGGGDPTLTCTELTAAAGALMQALPAGAVVDVAVDVGHRAAFIEPSSWSFAYLEDTRPDGMPSAVIVDRNRICLSAVPGVEPGDPVSLDWQHETDRSSVRVLNSVTTGPNDQPTEVAMRRAVDFRGVITVELTGQVAFGDPPHPIELQALDPNLRAAHLLAEAMAGIAEVGEVGLGQPPSASAVLVHAVESPPLREILRDCMQPSDNFLAENLLQLLAAHSDDTSAAPTAAAATTPAWDPVTPVTEGRQDGQASTAPAPMVGDVAKSLGVEPTQLRLVDGSGVSRQNLVTPRAVLQLLQAKRDDDEWHEFLTVAAEVGTLSGRFGGTVAAGELRGKTGTLDGVSALSGYYQGLVFSIMVNNVAIHANHAMVVEAVNQIALALCTLAEDGNGSPPYQRRKL